MGRCAAYLFALICCGGAANGWAAAIDAGAPKGAKVTSSVERKAETYRVPVAPFGGKDLPTVEMNGRIKWAAMSVRDGTVDDVIAFYRARLAKEGFERVLDCAGRACGGFDFRFGVDLMAPPNMQVDVSNFAQLTVKRAERPGVVSVLASDVRGTVYVQTVTVVPADGNVALTVLEDPEPTVAPAPDAALAPVPDKPAATGTPYERLIIAGHLAVTGVSFATGGSQLAGDSGAALDRVARMLQDNPDLQIAIVGHSDNQGGLNANIALSQRRAETVMRALIKRGIAARRLEARGIGYLSPLRANSTAEGRAMNRRVELVVR